MVAGCIKKGLLYIYCMYVTLKIKDETATGKIYNELAVKFNGGLVTVKEIIEQRVIAEADEYNNRLTGYFNGLVQPKEAEKVLNGYKLKDKKKVDAEKQVYSALEAFNKNVYFVLIDNIQAESLDQMILINDKTEISFIKLTPLVGG